MDRNVPLAGFRLHALVVCAVLRIFANDDDRHVVHVSHVLSEKLAALVEAHSGPEREERDEEPAAAAHIRPRLGIAALVVLASGVQWRRKDRLELIQVEGLLLILLLPDDGKLKL